MDLDSKLDNIFNDVLNVKEDNNNLIEWEEDPITFREFLISKDHLDFPEYSERQYEAIDALFGTEPKNTFFNDDACWMLISCWGKGSGKDTIFSSSFLSTCSFLPESLITYLFLNHFHDLT